MGGEPAGKSARGKREGKKNKEGTSPELLLPLFFFSRKKKKKESSSKAAASGRKERLHESNESLSRGCNGRHAGIEEKVACGPD